MSKDFANLRQDFPVLSRVINGKPLVYLDSANTSQKPHVVIDAMTDFLENGYAPINRSAYQMAAEATDLYEGARTAVAKFINAPNANEVIFTKNATEALNLIVRTWGIANLSHGDVVVLTHMEHHANIVPWHMLVAERGIVLRFIPSPLMVNSISATLTHFSPMPKCCHLLQCPMCSAQLILLNFSVLPRIAQVQSPLLTDANRCHIWPLMSKTWAQIFLHFLRTKCAGHQVLECCGDANSCLMQCRHLWAAET